jgi:hypothetical protein
LIVNQVIDVFSIQLDPAPHVFEDEVGLKLAAPDNRWRRRRK